MVTTKRAERASRPCGAGASSRPWPKGCRRIVLPFSAGLLVFLCPVTLPRTNPPIPTAASSLSVEQLLGGDTSSLGSMDIAAINLACAQGLPGAQNLERLRCLATLDKWAAQVAEETRRHLYRFRANPSEFESSEGYFRMLMMAVTLYEDCGVRYNPERMGTGTPGDDVADSFFMDSRDLFLHGLCGARRLGTCSSMPVLHAAIGRRLGYPLKLATTKSHVFLRWDGQGERFNVETTGKGMNRYDDDHFMKWPFPVSEAEAAEERYLKSLSPTEELALFLSLRGHCLRQAGRVPEAVEAYAAAARLAPEIRAYGLLLADAQNRIRGSSIEPIASQSPLVNPFPGMGPADPNPLLKVSTAAR
jgi:hypothetical protein